MLMMTAESMLSKGPILGITAVFHSPLVLPQKEMIYITSTGRNILRFDMVSHMNVFILLHILIS